MSFPAHGHSTDDYLETIYFLAFPIGEYRPAGSKAIAARVAEVLHVSRASAGEALKRLESEGYVERGAQKQALLTPKGEERAKHVVRKHRIIERFLTDFMGYTPAESHVQADLLGDTFSDDMVERIYDPLKRPDRCPHGWPIDPESEREENLSLVCLTDLKVGDECVIVRVAEHDSELMHWLYGEGFAPGITVQLTQKQPAVGTLKVVLPAGATSISTRPRRGCTYCLPRRAHNSAHAL